MRKKERGQLATAQAEIARLKDANLRLKEEVEKAKRLIALFMEKLTELQKQQTNPQSQSEEGEWEILSAEESLPKDITISAAQALTQTPGTLLGRRSQTSNQQSGDDVIHQVILH